MIYPFLDFAVFRKLYHGSYFIPNSYPCFGKYILQFTFRKRTEELSWVFEDNMI